MRLEQAPIFDPITQFWIFPDGFRVSGEFAGDAWQAWVLMMAAKAKMKEEEVE